MYVIVIAFLALSRTSGVGGIRGHRWQCYVKLPWSNEMALLHITRPLDGGPGSVVFHLIKSLRGETDSKLD